MTVITFDTLKFVEHLKHSGISEKQAKAISEAFRDAQSEAEIATRKDLRDFEHRVNNKFNLMEYRIMTRLGGLITVVGSLVVLFQKML